MAEIAWVSDDPHLSGNFAPIGPELNAADLPVIAGRIPQELSGAYMRTDRTRCSSRSPSPIPSTATA